MEPPLLWHFPVSHYNEKVRWAFDYKTVPHRRRALFLDYIPRAFWATRQLSLPIAFFEGRAVSDSTRIIEELEKRVPAPALYPADAAERERALDLETFFDEGVAPAVRTFIVGEAWERDPRRTVDLLATGNPRAPRRLAKALIPLMRANYRRRHQINPTTRAAARGQIEAGVARVERELAATGTGYLVGTAFSVADLSAAALLAPVADPAGLQYPIDSSLVPDGARQLRESLAEREGIVWVREMFRRHRGVSAEVGAAP